MKKNDKTIAIIVTYNRIELLKECILALVNSEKKCDILVVNNNSDDGTDEYLNLLPNIYKDINFYIYNLDENLNGAGGFNYGIKKAVSLDYEYVWLMDDDTIVDKYALTELYNIKIELNDEFGFLSSKVLWKDNSICKTNIQRLKVARRISDFKSKLVKVDFTSFVSCFVKISDILNIVEKV